MAEEENANSETPENIISRVRNMSSREKNVVQGTVQGATVGAGVGLLYGYFMDKNKWVTSIVGMATGGFVSRIFLNRA